VKEGTLKVSEQHEKAHMDGTPKTKVSIARMHKGSTGWSFVSDS
jgi:hypothetical protein